jgi:hypothetical protein
VGGKTRYYIGQTTTGSARVATDSTAWTFKWKAPSTNVGKVKFFTTVNATNNNGSDNGDYIYKKDFTITPSTLLSVASAKIADPVTCSNGTKFSGSATNNPTAYLWEEVFQPASLAGDMRSLSHVRVATKYPGTTSRYYHARGIQAECVKLNGAMELAPSLGLSGRIVDLVSSGKTLAENGLVETAVISQVSARLIVNRAAYKMMSGTIPAMVQRFRELTGARAAA